ncbi:MAG: histidine kinase, partial [Cyanobacteria bacterium P01_A01_bin.37]
MIETVVGAIADPIFEQLWKMSEGVFSDIKKTSNMVDGTNRLIAACEKYEQRFGDRHGRVKVMPGLMKEAVSLDSIYTAVKLLDDRSIRYFRTEQDLEEAYRKAARRSFQLGTDERLKGMEIANREQFLMVLGGPGIGKSTFLRKIGIEALKKGGQLQRECIPVLIELKDLKDKDIDLAKIIAKEFEVCGFPGAEAFTARVLE